MVANLNIEDLEFELLNPNDNSLIIRQDYVEAIYEYATDKMIVHLRPKDLLIINKMQVCKRIEEDDPSNVCKYQMTTLPNFNEDILPFIALSGGKSLNLLNLAKGTMQPLILAPIQGFSS